MIRSVEEYLDALKTELKDGDAATTQDALADAEEHLRVALASLREKQPEMPEEEALNQVIEQYGSPEETASAYKEVERLRVSEISVELLRVDSARAHGLLDFLVGQLVVVLEELIVETPKLALEVGGLGSRAP